VTSIGILLVADHYYPDTISNIPVLNTISDSIYVGWNYTTSYISNVFSNLFGGRAGRQAGQRLFKSLL
jgi:hypothetical protein